MVVSWPHKLIADLRYGTFELYDLERDPRERDNLADDHPAVVQGLDGALRSWLDSLADAADDPYASTLYRGRLVDRSVSPELAAIVSDARAPAAVRAEAARLLGSLPSAVTVTALTRAVSDDDDDVRAEAAIALTWLERRAGQPGARRLLDVGGRRSAGARRHRARPAARSEAVPVLIQAMADPAVSEPHRFEAVRLLGLSRDERAVEPLLALLDDGRIRRRAVLALGNVGDARAFEPLVAQLASAQHSTVRESSARALGQLADPRAIDPLITAAIRDRLPSAGESLVRLGALEGRVGGLDLAPGVTGLGECHALPRTDEDAGYLNRTYCEAPARSELTLALPDAVRAAPSVMVLLERAGSTPARPSRSARASAPRSSRPCASRAKWAEHRAEVQSARLAPVLILEADDAAARLAIDHVLVLPMP
ncbi:MAG: HEAT repeat domain-containing protein [Sandaracinaceae bacterium]|nr:HEAT repeat domain-containing protein [Sandaracinaceae bacterium]